MIALLLALLLATQANAAVPSWLDRAANAPLQVVGRCESRTSRWEGGSIYSYSEVSVLRVVLGTPDSVLVIRQRGGQVDGVGQKVSHISLLEPGQSYLLFLSKDDSGSWSTTSKGVNRIVTSADGSQSVASEPLDQILAELGGAN
jgi:hypothetical protein